LRSGNRLSDGSPGPVCRPVGTGPADPAWFLRQGSGYRPSQQRPAQICVAATSCAESLAALSNEAGLAHPATSSTCPAKCNHARAAIWRFDAKQFCFPTSKPASPASPTPWPPAPTPIPIVSVLGIIISIALVPQSVNSRFFCQSLSSVPLPSSACAFVTTSNSCSQHQHPTPFPS
jgi:hypothetical protein